MTKYIILTFFFFISVTSFAQKTLSDYSYVVVPEQFSFLEGKDKYQISSLTEYLFNKYGFNAYLNSEAPNAKRCDGLYADLKEENTFFRTKLRVQLKDCNGTVVYTGDLGNSKFKEYRKAYQDATRKAFQSISTLGVNQKNVELIKNEEISEENITSKPPKAEKSITAIQKNVNTTSNKTVVKNVAISNLPEAKFLNYTAGGKSFLLRKTNAGYSLYEESNESNNGLLLKGTISVSDNEIIFENTTGETYDVYFDENQNLSLFKGEQVILYTLN